MSDRPQILAVDDTPANLQILSEVLGAEGYQLRVATSAHAARTSSSWTSTCRAAPAWTSAGGSRPTPAGGISR
jgi:CheY-like chemotaxis protein